MKIIPSALLLLSLLFHGCQPRSDAARESVSSEETTKQILDHHWQTFKSNDLEGTMEDYTEESILITPDKIFRGLHEIRENFIVAFAAFPKDSTHIQLNKSVVQQDVGYIIWEATTPSFKLTYGTDTFIIQNGKILKQTYAGVKESL